MVCLLSMQKPHFFACKSGPISEGNQRFHAAGGPLITALIPAYIELFVQSFG
jgi:hypothetical protein